MPFLNRSRLFCKPEYVLMPPSLVFGNTNLLCISFALQYSRHSTSASTTASGIMMVRTLLGVLVLPTMMPLEITLPSSSNSLTLFTACLTEIDLFSRLTCSHINAINSWGLSPVSVNVMIKICRINNTNGKPACIACIIPFFGCLDKQNMSIMWQEMTTDKFPNTKTSRRRWSAVVARFRFFYCALLCGYHIQRQKTSACKRGACL